MGSVNDSTKQCRISFRPSLSAKISWSVTWNINSFLNLTISGKNKKNAPNPHYRCVIKCVNFATALSIRFIAERVGFEPTVPFWSTHTFQACSFDHSDISPDQIPNLKSYPLQLCHKSRRIFHFVATLTLKTSDKTQNIQKTKRIIRFQTNESVRKRAS